MRIRASLVVGAAAIGALALAGTASAEPPEVARPGASQVVEHVSMPIRGQAPDGVPGAAKPGGGAGKTPSNGINYRGGPVMTNGVNVYIIWYGDWSNDSATTILPDFVENLGPSAYFNINTTYYNANKNPVVNDVKLAGQITDSGSQGTINLSDTAIKNIVTNAIGTGPAKLPLDKDGVYLVLTAKDVTKSGFLTQYCGWHTYTTVGTTAVKYSFVGNPGSNGACSVQTSVSPNNNVGADAMVSVIAHEIEEAVTDPQLNAWYDNRGYENADKCAWKFGTLSTASNGSKYNVTLGDRQFLIQQNWVNASGGYCAMSYVTPAN